MTRKPVRLRKFLISMACLCLAGGLPAAGQGLVSSGYRIKPSDVHVPEDVPLGQYRRIIRPFDNWTLICDENLKVRQMVCNVSQVIEDGAGQVVFSWSLAATKDGKPYMILRVPPSANSGGKVSLQFQGRPNPVQVELEGCNQSACVGMVPVGPLLREQIDKGSAPDISYQGENGQKITVTAPLKGLTTAVKAIK